MPRSWTGSKMPLSRRFCKLLQPVHRCVCQVAQVAQAALEARLTPMGTTAAAAEIRTDISFELREENPAQLAHKWRTKAENAQPVET
jgi:hypothetical protein